MGAYYRKGGGYNVVLIDARSFFVATNDAERAERDQRELLRSLIPTPAAAEELIQYFYQQTRDLIQTKSFSMTGAGKLNVDVVQDVLKYVPVHWVMTEIVSLHSALWLRDAHPYGSSEFR
jgi:linoleate 10R-lipoxygenase